MPGCAQPPNGPALPGANRPALPWANPAADDAGAPMRSAWKRAPTAEVTLASVLRAMAATVFSRASDSAASVDTVALKLWLAWPAVFVAVTVTIASPSISGATVTWPPATVTLTASPDADAEKVSAVAGETSRRIHKGRLAAGNQVDIRQHTGGCRRYVLHGDHEGLLGAALAVHCRHGNRRHARGNRRDRHRCAGD